MRERISYYRQYRLSIRDTPMIPVKPIANFNYVTLTCRKDLKMTQLSLETLVRHSSALPELVVAYDESLTENEVQEAFKFWSRPFLCLDRLSTAKFHHDQGQQLLANFCDKHIFGFKLSVCLRVAQQNRVLYADSDVLWFRDSVELMKRYSEKAIYAAEDYNDSYNKKLLLKLDEQLQKYLAQTPFINAGFAIFNRFIPEIDEYKEFLSYILAEQPIHHFSEQTLVAILTKTIGDTIKEQDVYVKEHYLTSWKASFCQKPWIARHYISPVRHQLWIDAITAVN
ncbi:hypothetical protein HCG51_15610 [Tolypothrix sp. PCC 7910]|uniref:hypothetical protein n=1 Tax=Tolypothrix sp. PCC 7910 TaxID=2099387 RepID=UPI00142777E9|nr:hypothetical protein [Tolypothrix sp. PCC 7910]QIR37987.1 hypothetical protein HCG51_15610 [Tolypothrix sp. PCC 7910]